MSKNKGANNQNVKVKKFEIKFENTLEMVLKKLHVKLTNFLLLVFQKLQVTKETKIGHVDLLPSFGFVET